MSCLFNLDVFQDGLLVVVQILFPGLFHQGFVQISSKNSYAITVKPFLNTLSQRLCGASI